MPYLPNIMRLLYLTTPLRVMGDTRRRLQVQVLPWVPIPFDVYLFLV